MFTAQQNLRLSHPLTVFFQRKLASYTPDGLDQILHTMLTESPADLPDMVFESIIRIDIMICFPSSLTKFFLCNYFTHTFHKDLQDDKLLRRKTEIFPMKVSPSSFQVNFEAVSWNKNRCALWTIFPKIRLLL